VNWQGKPKYSEKTCPNATLSTTIPRGTDPGSNPGRRSGKPATTRLSCGIALVHLTENSVTIMIFCLCVQICSTFLTPKIIHKHTENVFESRCVLEDESKVS
jgi:hypothetical protein